MREPVLERAAWGASKHGRSYYSRTRAVEQTQRGMAEWEITGMSDKSSTPTQAYLLRCWKRGDATNSEERRWRFSVEDVLHKGPRQGFESLDRLVAFLQAELGRGDSTPGRLSEDESGDH